MDEKMKKKLLEALKAKGYSDEDAEAFINEVTSEDESVKDDVEKAEKNIEEKGADEQTKKDRVDESVGEQLKDDGKKDEQSAKDRVDESEGEEKAEEEKKEKPEEEPAKEEAPAEEPKQEDNTEIESLKAKIKTLEDENGTFKTALLELQKTVEKLQQKPVPVPESQKTKLDKYTRQYEN